MITKKKKYTLYSVMALACGLVASFFIYSCSADGYYSDEIEKLDWEPHIHLEEGLMKVIDYFKSVLAK